MKTINIFYIFCVIATTSAILEQDTDDEGNIVWAPGAYRDRDVVPMPTDIDLEKKHKRDVIDNEDDDDNDEDDSEEIKARPSKKSFIRTHFSLPIGAEIPLSYSGKVQRKGKKSIVPRVRLEDKLTGDSRYNLLKLKKKESPDTRSKVHHMTWGLTWEDPYLSAKLNKDSKGYGRSKLEGVKIDHISEEEFDSGLMGRGLGGMKERAQNENLMEKKFEQKIDDESDVENENSRRRM